MNIEAVHHEVSTGGQNEIDMRFDSLLSMGDTLKWFKYIVKNVAFRNGKTVTFMPKPILTITAQGCTVTSRCGRMARTSLPGTATVDFPKWPCITLVES